MRRILRFADDYPTAQRVMLATNYRCPAGVIEASARMVAVNRERFEKPIRPPPGAMATDDDIVAISTAEPGWADAMAHFAAAEAEASRTVCFLSRTRAELMPVLLALVRQNVAHATSVPMAVDAEPVLSLVAAMPREEVDVHPFTALEQCRRARGWSRGDPAADALSDEEVSAVDALMGWSVGFADVSTFAAAFSDARTRLAALRDSTALVELATAHGSKGREWQTVVLIGFEADRMPNRRSLVDAPDSDRAMEEERRLAYVALTRATRQLILAFDPSRASPFLAEMALQIAV